MSYKKISLILFQKYRYLMVECEDENEAVRKMYGKVDYQFMTAMTKV